jgi:hypothetical protein
MSCIMVQMWFDGVPWSFMCWKFGSQCGGTKVVEPLGTASRGWLGHWECHRII